MKPTTPILIVGAGPTGLVLALSLARQGAAFRIIDANEGPIAQSRAMGVQARTLELYQQFGIAEQALALGIPATRVRLRSSGEEITTLSLERMGAGLSPYPYLLCLAQDVHERLLVERLMALGVEIEWGRRLERFEQDDEGVTATLADAHGKEKEAVRSDWLVGCDGAHSAVRRGLGLAFDGGTHEGRFFVADVDIDTRDAGERCGDIHVSIDEDSVVLRFPVRTTGAQRLLGIVPPALAHHDDLNWETLRERPERALGVRVTAVHWFSTYHVSHRVAERFRVGRVFVAGDAGHIHSPLGGQGMNTGIGDAINLGWKLAGVVAGRAAETVLDTYEPERIAFARTLIASTDRAFGPMVSDSAFAHVLRGFVAPNAARVLPHLPGLPARIFRTISQTRVDYRGSALAEGDTGELAGGDRLPWVEGADNFAPLASLDWQLHVHGGFTRALRQTAEALGLAAHAFDWREAAARAGFAHDAAYLVRPDGHIALAGAEPASLRRYARHHGLVFGPNGG